MEILVRKHGPCNCMLAAITPCFVSQRRKGRKGHTRLQGPCLAPALKPCSTAYSTIRYIVFTRITCVTAVTQLCVSCHTIVCRLSYCCVTADTQVGQTM